MADTPPSDGVDVMASKRETTTDIKSLIRTFEHSASAERVPGLASTPSEEPSTRQLPKTVSQVEIPKDAAQASGAYVFGFVWT